MNSKCGRIKNNRGNANNNLEWTKLIAVIYKAFSTTWNEMSIHHLQKENNFTYKLNKWYYKNHFEHSKYVLLYTVDYLAERKLNFCALVTFEEKRKFIQIHFYSIYIRQICVVFLFVVITKFRLMYSPCCVKCRGEIFNLVYCTCCCCCYCFNNSSCDH